MKRILPLFLAAVLLALAGCGTASPGETTGAPETDPAQWEPRVTALPSEDGALPQLEDPTPETPIVTLHTSAGDIKIMLFPEQAPRAVENFVTHCGEGYYDGVSFHRVIQGFMIQSGDPEGTGSGGESIWGTPFPDEFSDGLHHFRGALSMANRGTDTNGSQFFIVQGGAAAQEESRETVEETWMQSELQRQYDEAAASGMGEEELETLLAALQETLEQGVTQEWKDRFDPAYDAYMTQGGVPSLDYNYTVFGQVIEGMDVVDAIAGAEVKENAAGEVSSPVEPVLIESVTVETAES